MLEVLIFMCCESFTWLIYDSFTAFISYWNIMMIYCWWLVTDDVIMTSLKTLWWRHLILFQVKNESSHYLKLLSIQSNSFRDRPAPGLQNRPMDIDGPSDVRFRSLGSDEHWSKSLQFLAKCIFRHLQIKTTFMPIHMSFNVEQELKSIQNAEWSTYR